MALVYLIGGSTHTGKTLLAQRLLEKHGWPYLSMDHLKMGLIRSGHCALSPESPDDALTAYLWPVVREMVKTCIENGQNLIVEGCYIPFDYEKDFDSPYLKEIKYTCLIFSRSYIESHFDDAILRHESAIERRLEAGDVKKEALISENEKNLALCKAHQLEYILIDGTYCVDISIYADTP